MRVVREPLIGNPPAPERERPSTFTERGPEPCPICNHPTGDCTGEHAMAPEKDKAAADEAEKNPSNPRATAPETKASNDDQKATTTVAQSGRLRDDAYHTMEVEAPTVGRLLAGADPNADEVDLSGFEGDGPNVVAPATVYEEFYYPDTKRPSYRLIATEGQTVSREGLETIQAARAAS